MFASLLLVFILICTIRLLILKMLVIIGKSSFLITTALPSLYVVFAIMAVLSVWLLLVSPSCVFVLALVRFTCSHPT